MSKENRVKIGIVAFLFLICFIVITIVYFNRKETEQPKEENLPFNMQRVTEYNIFFSVVNNINQYLYYNSSSNSVALYNILNSEYISENNITLNNVLTKLELYKNSVSFKAKNMFVEENSNNNLYYVLGDIIESEFEDTVVIKENAKFFILIDYSNISVSIYPVNKEIDSIPIQNKTQSIILNSYNQLQASGLVTENYICNLYYSDFVNRLVENLDETYDLLENKSNVNKEDYIKYMNNNLGNINLEITSCNVSTSNNRRVYTIRDANNNSFTFTEESIMNYKVNFHIN